MNMLNRPKCILLAILVLALLQVSASAENEKPSLKLSLKYYCESNRIPYLIINTESETGDKLRPAPGMRVQLYLDDTSDVDNLLGQYVTDKEGMAKAVLPVSVRKRWMASGEHTFIAISAPDRQFDRTEAEVSMVKSRMLMDTLNTSDGRGVMVTLLAWKNGKWTPVPDVDIKVAVRRMSSIIKVGEDDTYTTDAEGTITAPYGLKDLPGDREGKLSLVALVEDNEELGNVSTERIVPWGKPTVATGLRLIRSLWGAKSESPVWLIVVANTILTIIWGILIYLIILLIRIIRAGKEIRAN